MKREMHTVVGADDRETLVSFITMRPMTLGAKGLGVVAFGPGKGPPALEIEMPCCGETRRYQHTYHIPVNSVGPCPCGNWLICYRYEPLQVLF